MSEIVAPTWFKNALNDWSTAIWYPLPVAFENPSEQEAYNSPTVSASISAFSDDGMSALDLRGTHKNFSPYERLGALLDSRPDRNGFLEVPVGTLSNGAIIIVGHAMNDSNYTPEVYNKAPWSADGGEVGVNVHPPFPGNEVISVIATSGYSASGKLHDGLALPEQHISSSGSPVPPMLRYENYSRPQHRCAVLGISPTGDIVIGEGHPAYAGSRPMQRPYVSIGTLNPARLAALTQLETWVTPSYADAGSRNVPLRTFVEVLLPGVEPIKFPPTVGLPDAVWWRNKNLCIEGEEPVLTDKRGFPIGDIPNMRYGDIPPYSE